MSVTLSRDIHRHRGELARALRRREFEFNDAGNLIVPSMKLEAKPLGIFDHAIKRRGDIDFGERFFDDNLLPLEMRNFILNRIYGNTGSPVSTWYIAPFKDNATPDANLTGENFDATLGEFTDYDEATRVAFNEGTSTTGTINNHSNRAVFTIVSNLPSPVNLYGAALLQAAAKNDATAGQKCGAASRFAAAREVQAGDTLSIGYGVTLTST